MKEKMVVVGIISLFVMTCFTALPCISTTTTIHKLNEIATLNQDETYSIIWSNMGNPPLPPVIWTEDFFTFYTTIPQNPDGDQLYYWFDWGDGTNSSWVGPFDSGETVSISHVWSDEGTYQIMAKAKDEDGESKCVVYGLMLSSNKYFGVEIGYVNITYIFTIYWEDCEYYYIYIDWDDGQVTDWLGPYNKTVLFSHSWSYPGDYHLRVKMKDIYGNETDWLTFLIKILSLENNPPGAPTITGPSSGKAGIELSFIFNAIDPDGDQVRYIIDWGDGKSDTTGLNPSGIDVTVKHAWNHRGTFKIKVKAQDEHGLDGPYPPSVIILITKNKDKAINTPFIQFFQNLLENQINLFSKLRQLLEL